MQNELPDDGAGNLSFQLVPVETFADEYIEVMKPIAEALDILQGDVGAGLVIPTNWILRQKLEQVHVCDATPLPSHFFHFSPSCWSSFQFGSKGGKRLPIS